MSSDDKIIPINRKDIEKNLAELDAAKLPDGTLLNAQDLETLRTMNKVYTHAVVGGRNLVISLKHCQIQGKAFAFEAMDEFSKSFIHKPKLGTSPDGKAYRKNQGRAWLEWDGKNYKPEGTGFYPDPTKCPKHVFNFFRGLRVAPIEGDCSLYLDHLKDVICAGDEVSYTYLIQWLAHIFQKPDQKPSVAVLLKSVEGTGKGSMVEPLLDILGAHGNKTNGSYSIAGRFNGIVANKLLVFGDEVDLSDKKTADRLKSLISESSVNLERKGLEIEPLPNYCRLIFASNHSKVLNAGTRERRYLVLEPSPEKAQDTEYFKALWAWIREADSAAKLLHYLLSVDISNFNPYKAPQTAALIAEKIESLSGINRYVYEEIMKQEPFGGKARIIANDLVDDFVRWSERDGFKINYPAARSATGKMMARLNIPVLGRSDVSTGKYYDTPSRYQLVQVFASLLDIQADELGI